MVSTSKMRKTQERMRLARPYADKVRLVMSHLAQTHESHGIRLLEERKGEIKRAGFILITTDKGLCGGLNANLLKNSFCKYKNINNKVWKWKWCIGSKGLAACQRVGLMWLLA